MEAIEREGVKDASHLYEVERRARHAERPGFRISELQIGPRQQVPWHYHNNIEDTFYVLQGRVRLFLRDPKEEVRLRRARRTWCEPAARIWSPTAARARRSFWSCRASASTTTSR
jgi:hypothetical protein